MEGRFSGIARALVFHNEDAGPEKINETVIAGDLFHRFLEAGNGAAADAEHAEKFIPKAFRLGLLAGLAFPFIRKPDGVVTDFVPTDGHGEE